MRAVLLLLYIVIDKFPFATDGNATDVGDLSVYTDMVRSQVKVQQLMVMLLVARLPSVGTPNTIDKFSFHELTVMLQM